MLQSGIEVNPSSCYIL
uniref:Uncharacterized protein n=1 Tax=Anopheles arabiensis TaxID=7173 RepID=A0A182IF35_ANOAR